MRSISDGAGGVAVEAEGLLGDLGDACEFGVGGFEEELDGRGDIGIGAGEVDEVGDGFEGIVDLVGDGGGEAAGGGELFALAEGVLLGFAGGDVLDGADHADDVFAVGGVVGVAAGGDPGLDAVGGVDAVLGAVDSPGLEELLQGFGGVGLVFGGDDALAQGGAGDGDVRLGVEEAGGALVEVEEVGGAIPGPGAELGGVEGLAEAVGGLALEGAGGVDVGDLVGKVFGEAKVIDGDGGLGGDGADEVFAGCGEDVGIGMAVEQAAEDVAGAAAHGDAEVAAHGRTLGREPGGGAAGEGKILGVAGIEGDVGGADDLLAEEAVPGHRGSWRAWRRRRRC